MSGKSLEMTTGCCLTSVHSWLPFGGVARTIAPAQIISNKFGGRHMTEQLF